MISKIKCLILRRNLFAFLKTCKLVGYIDILFDSLYKSKSLCQNIKKLKIDHCSVKKQQLSNVKILSLLFVFLPVSAIVAQEQMNKLELKDDVDEKKDTKNNNTLYVEYIIYVTLCRQSNS